MNLEVRHWLSDQHGEQLLRLFEREWWAADRSADDLRRMLAGTDIVTSVIDAQADRLLGFARAITDRTDVAVILDVIVALEYRGRGVGRLLMEAILSRGEIACVNSVELVCQPELQPFYERWGFSTDVGRSRLMRRTSDPALAPRS